MTQIHIDAEHARKVGRRLTAEEDRLADISHKLQRAINSPDTWGWAWVSHARHGLRD